MAVAFIVGGGDCVWRDAHSAFSLATPDAIFAVNDMMRLWPLRIDYGITLHADKIAIFKRGAKSRSVGYPVWSHRRPAGSMNSVTHVTQDWHGSSGLFAVKVAQLEKFDAIVLAGVPMDYRFTHIVRKKQWVECEQYRRGWIKHLPAIAPYVRSMSGWTKELLGAPSTEWLKANAAAPPDEDLVRALKERTDGLTQDAL